MTHWMEDDWPDEDERDVLLKCLCKMVRDFINSTSLPDTEVVNEKIGQLEDILDEVNSRYESNDPRDMGWVGDDGLP